MHEMGLAQEIIRIAAAALPADGAHGPVERVNIRIGKLTAVVPDSLVFCFNIIAEESPFSGADLQIEAVPAVGRCRGCDFEWEIVTPAFACAQCRNGPVEIVSGRELEIVSIEILDKPEGRKTNIG